jgi:NADPH:quinone reductase-like Zn-dependent oxidoreductase
VTELDEPAPGPHQVVVDVAAAGVNFPDLLVVGGTYQNLPSLPFVPGKEIAGTVVATGDAVTTPAVGDRVAAQVEYGAFAERVAVEAANAVRIPDGVDFPTAAGFGMGFLTAQLALVRRAGLRPGETVLVTGANGDVGSAAIQLVSALGGRAIAAVRSATHAETLRELGAEHVIVGDPGTLRDKARELTKGRGADIVIDNIGGETFAQALRCVAWEGRLVVVGFASGGDIPMIKSGHLLVKNISVLGLQASDYRDREPATMREVQQKLFELYLAGKLRLPITARFPLEDAADALELARRGGLLGKVILELRTGQ